MMQPKSNSSTLLHVVPVVISFAAAMVLMVVALPESISNYRPDFVALVLIFWCLYYPSRVGLLVAFTVGLLADVMYFGILGQHAVAKLVIAYVVLRFVSDSDSKNRALQQSVIVLFLLLLNVLIVTVISRFVHGQYGSHVVWLTPLVGATIWYLFVSFRRTRTTRRYGIFQ